MRLAVLGDSHVAALKAGWDRMDSHPGFELVFFASRSTGLADLAIGEGALVPATATLRDHLRHTSGGLDHVDPTAYDAFLVYGLRCLVPDPEPQSIWSQAVRAAALADNLNDSLSVATVKKLRAVTGKPCFVGHTPLAVSRTPGAAALAPAMLDRQIALMQRAVFDGLNAVLHAQPAGTAVEPMNTDERFVNGALTLAVGDARDGASPRLANERHMNADFGQLWLQSFLARHLAARVPLAVGR